MEDIGGMKRGGKKKSRVEEGREEDDQPTIGRGEEGTVYEGERKCLGKGWGREGDEIKDYKLTVGRKKKVDCMSGWGRKVCGEEMRNGWGREVHWEMMGKERVWGRNGEGKCIGK